ncbi:MAG: hypothetical protein ACR2PZ_15040 [Pseudomonadales bacterium]
MITAREYSTLDATALAKMVAKQQLSPAQLAEAAKAAIELANPSINALNELYPERFENPRVSAHSPLCGIPLLLKDAGSVLKI